MFRFAGRNEKAAKPLKTNDPAKFLIAFSFRKAQGGLKRNERFVFAAPQSESFAEAAEVAKSCVKAQSSPWNR
jgi:hypothetical protein